MSAVLPKIDGWVGYSDGAEALLRTDEPWDSEHPLVKERPELFDTPAETLPVEKAAPAKKTTAKKAAAGG